MLERDQTFNDIWDRIERLEMQIEDLRDVSRPTDVVILEGEWQSFAGWISDGTVLQDINGQIILDPSEPCILVGADGYIQSQDYVPGVSGWRIDGTGADLVDVEIPTVAPAFTFSTAAAEGAADTFVRSDATLAIFDAANPTQIDAGDAAATGAAGVAARRDHAHAVDSTADGDTNHSTLLQSDASGHLRLAGLGIGVAAGAADQITMVDGGSIGQAAGPLLTFDDGNDYLEITGAFVGIGIAAPGHILHVQDDSDAIVRIRLDNSKVADTGNYATLDLALKSDAQARLALSIQAGFSNIADAARTSKVFFRTWDDGSVSNTLSLLGKRVSVGHTTSHACLDVRQSTTTGPTIYAYRNLASGSTDSPVLSVVQDNAGDDQAAVYVQQDGAGAAIDVVGNITITGTVDGVDVAGHAARHKRAGADEIDGDQLDIDWNPTNYTPTATAEAPNVDDLGAHLKGIDDKLPYVGGAGKSCRVYRNTDQTIPDGAWTAVSFSHERWDDDGMWAIGNPTRLTAKTAGSYVITGHTYMSDASYWVAIQRNGAQILVQEDLGKGQMRAVTTTYKMAINDYVEIFILQNTGVNQTLYTSSDFSPEFMMALV
jgi:hypothetical protein